MAKSSDPNGELRAAFTPRLLKQARESAYGGVPGMLVRIALGTLFVALVWISHELMGATGLVFVGTLFVILVFLPIFIRLFRTGAQKDVIESGISGEGVDPNVAGAGANANVVGEPLAAESASKS